MVSFASLIVALYASTVALAGDQQPKKEQPLPLTKKSLVLGGSGGKPFDDVNNIKGPVNAIGIDLRGSKRLDGIGVRLDDDRYFYHGGGGGKLKSLDLSIGDYWTTLYICQGGHDGSFRIFYAKVTSAKGKTIDVGTTTDFCATYTCPLPYSITGLFGRAGEEIDQLGAVYSL